MVEKVRKRIGIFFVFGKIWMGGVYYLASLVRALNYLEESKQPDLTVFYNDEGKEFLDLLDYPRLEKKYLEEYDNRSYITFIKSLLFNKNLYFKDLLTQNNVAGVFPVYNFAGKIEGKGDKRMVAWYPDLQHKFYPQYFSRLNLIAREFRIKKLLKQADDLVVSSNDVYSHFKKFYNLPATLKVHVLPFVSIIDHIEYPKKKDVLQKYKIDKPYFIVSNQFYEHKNHIVVFKALQQILKTRNDFYIICTGVMTDYKNPTYYQKLEDLSKSDGVKNNLKILGFIPREDQLSLMKNALSVIQPSKFEGWSTVIEDGKSLQTQIIASDIAVHKEQLGNKGFFFPQDDAKALSIVMNELIDKTVASKETFNNYHERIRIYADKFISIFE